MKNIEDIVRDYVILLKNFIKNNPKDFYKGP